MAGYVGSRIVNTLTNLDGVAIDGAAITNSTIVPVTPFTFRNRIINGNLSNPINQRGAASITASTGYTYDRWYYDGSTYLYQGIEDKNVNNGTYVISWVGAGINAAWKVSTDTTANNGPDATTGFTSVSNGGTFTVNEGTEYSKHLWIRFDGTLANLDKVQVEEGTVATPFEHRPIGTELALCQRYAIMFGNNTVDSTGDGGNLAVGWIDTIDKFSGMIFLPTTMRERPALNASGTNNFEIAYTDLNISTVSGVNISQILGLTTKNLVFLTISSGQTNQHRNQPASLRYADNSLTDTFLLESEL